ncbi:DUF1963 domain-containing protein [Croceimicrobium hydrocarbonivorans]|uniref:DUF1963 domain-containing protein n=1 Tax=Croceimicrobium hydrocarbonivorans TaxID=2761580 RepID=A0A7H0VHG7_9FLAO|nr:DUF1963 domain-containing protein [Croceimicrobium hydrocarbonivorans]QNR25165.1 DUF1963 domain-containing protein [Croceimicrobium hydrocarbonivorans]
MTREEFETKIKKPAILFQVGGFRPTDSKTASWIGKVMVGEAGESWPESNGKPMIPICQLNLKELPSRPDNLKDIEFISLFIDSEELPNDQANGDLWLIRSYANIEDLVEIDSPEHEFPIKAFPLKVTEVENDFPCWEDCPTEIPEEYKDEYYQHFPNQEGFKIGGWPTLIQSEISWGPFNEHPAEPEYVFQIDSSEKAHLGWGDSGVAYIGRGTKPGYKDVWTFSWQGM